MTNQNENYRQRQIRKVEEDINLLNINIAQKEQELERMWAEQAEMRETLQLLKAGRVSEPVDIETRRRPKAQAAGRPMGRKGVTFENIRDAAMELRQFTQKEFEDKLDVHRNTARKYIRQLEERGVIRRSESGGDKEFQKAFVYQFIHPTERNSEWVGHKI